LGVLAPRECKLGQHEPLAMKTFAMGPPRIDINDIAEALV
jgi:hypothetical protein